MFLYPLAIVYLILLVFGFKATWHLVAEGVLAGSSGVLLPVLLFIVIILVVGPVMGAVNLVKLAIRKR